MGAPSWGTSIRDALRTLGYLFNFRPLVNIAESFSEDAFGERARLTVGSPSSYNDLTIEAREGGEEGNTVIIEIRGPAESASPVRAFVMSQERKHVILQYSDNASSGWGTADLIYEAQAPAVAITSGVTLIVQSRFPGSEGNGHVLELILDDDRDDESIDVKWITESDGSARLRVTFKAGTITYLALINAINAFGKGMTIRLSTVENPELLEAFCVVGGSFVLADGHSTQVSQLIMLSSSGVVDPETGAPGFPPSLPPTYLSGGRDPRATLDFDFWGPAAFELPKRKSVAPDWHRVTIANVMPFMSQVGELTDRALGKLSFAPAISVAVDRLASLLKRKADAIDRLGTDIDRIVQDMTRLVSTLPFQFISIPTDVDEVLQGGAREFFNRARSADGFPDFGPYGAVGGIVLLASQPADYVKIRDLLGIEK